MEKPPFSLLLSLSFFLSLSTQREIYSLGLCVCFSLSVGLGGSLDLILLLDGGRGRGASGSVHDLISQAFGDGLHVSEGSLSSTGSHHIDALVDSSEGRHIHGLSSHDTRATHSHGVFSGAGVGQSLDEHLHGVAVGGEVDDVEGVFDDSASLELLAGVSALSHEGVHESLHDGAEGLLEPLGLVSAGGVGQEDGGVSLKGDVVLDGDVGDLDVVQAPARRAKKKGEGQSGRVQKVMERTDSLSIERSKGKGRDEPLAKELNFLRVFHEGKRKICEQKKKE